MYADVLDADWGLGVRMIVNPVGINKITEHTVITEDLQMRKIGVNLIPRVRKKPVS